MHAQKFVNLFRGFIRRHCFTALRMAKTMRRRTTVRRRVDGARAWGEKVVGKNSISQMPK